MEKNKNELKQHWFSSFMRNDKIFIKINNEIYSSYLAEISNIHYEEGYAQPLFDIKYDNESLYDDEAYNKLISSAVGEILIKAVAAEKAAINNAMNTVVDNYFNKFFNNNGIKINSDLTISQLLKMNKLYPIPLPESDEEIFPSAETEINDYLKNMKWDSEFSVFDLADNNKEYNLTKEEDKQSFIILVNDKLKQFIVKETK